MKRKFQYEQHFFRSPRLVAELIGHTNIRKKDTVYDLGAGSGIITAVLSRRCRQVIAVEKDAETLKLLRKNVGDLHNVTIVHDDLLSVQYLQGGPYKIFSNPPFSLSARLVSHLVWLPNPPSTMYLIVQRQFGQKLMNGSGHFTSQLGMCIAPWWSVRIRRPLKKSDFWPHPAVDTVLIEIRRRDEALLSTNERDRYRQFIRECFETPAFMAAHSEKEDRQRAASRRTVDELIAVYQEKNR